MEDKELRQLGIDTTQIKSLREVALETLRDAIITGYLKPGEHIKERDLSEEMGISTTPIKEAIRILSYEGLVETLPRKGNFVSELVDSSIEEILMLRAKLEGFVAKLATQKLTDEEINALEKDILLMERLAENNDSKALTEINSQFHNKIHNGINNPIIHNMVMNLGTFDYSFRKRALMHNQEIKLGISEHRAIFEAIKERKPKLAEERMTKHIERTAENVLKNIKDNAKKES